MRTLWSVLFLIAICSTAYADIEEEVFNNISQEYVDCGCYFTIVSQSLKNAGKFETAEDYEKLSDLALSHALDFARKGRTDEMAQKVTLSRFEFGLKSMSLEMDNDASNISILINQHALRCQQLMENPDAIWKEWTEKIR